MSVWAYFEGTIQIPKSAHFSLQDLFDKAFYEKVVKIDQDTKEWSVNRNYKVEVSFCEEGNGAADTFKYFIAALPKGSFVDLEFKNRYIGVYS